MSVIVGCPLLRRVDFGRPNCQFYHRYCACGVTLIRWHYIQESPVVHLVISMSFLVVKESMAQ